MDGDEKSSVTIQKLVPQNLGEHQRFFVCSGWWRKTKDPTRARTLWICVSLCISFLRPFHKIQIFTKADWKVMKNLWRQSGQRCGWSLQVFQHHWVCFVNISISWNGLGENYLRPSKHGNWYWNWCGFEAFQDPLHHHPNPETDTDADADHKRL